MTGRVELTGGCHCGMITHALAWPEKELPVPSRSCTCTRSFCTKHGN